MKFDKIFKKIINENLNYSLFRELSVDEAVEFIHPNMSSNSPGGPKEYYFSTDRNLALGQGQNKSGIVIEIISNGLTIYDPINKKPSHDFLKSTTGHSEKIVKEQPSEIKKNVLSIEVENKIRFKPRTMKKETGNIYYIVLNNILNHWGHWKISEEKPNSTIYKPIKY
jgi:hypothetical protein